MNGLICHSHAMQEQAQNTKFFHADCSTARASRSGGCAVVFLNACLPSHTAMAYCTPESASLVGSYSGLTLLVESLSPYRHFTNSGDGKHIYVTQKK